MIAARSVFAAVLALVAMPAFAQDAPAAPADAADVAVVVGEVPAMTEAEAKVAFKAAYSFQDGPLDGDLGEATIKIPAGYIFTGKAGTVKWDVDGGGLADEGSRGLIQSPAGWMLMFSYEETGHIKDDEKDELDKDALLDSYKEGTTAGNERRQQAGMEPLFIDGWEQIPAYNDAEKVLEWAITAHSPSQARIVNFNTRLLGRTGVMSAVLMYGNDVQLKDISADYRAVLSTFAFKGGQNYSEYKDGDKLAEYGLAALVAGGGVALAAKSGLLAKFGILLAKGGKALIVAIVAIGAGIANFAKRVFGKKD